MIDVSTKITTNKDSSKAVSDGVRRYLVDVASAGYLMSRNVIAEEATDTGILLASGFEPEVLSDGSVVWGYQAPYARAVDQGTRPHYPPIDALKGWARRVLGDAGAAYAVQQKIGREGTEGVHFVRKSVDAMRAKAQVRGVREYIRDEL